MKALIYKGKGSVALEDRPQPTVESPTDAVVKVVYTTICGTDTHILKGKQSPRQAFTCLPTRGPSVLWCSQTQVLTDRGPGDVPTCEPGRVLGHEGVGVVEETGSGIRSFKKGDRVLISCISSCATCVYCRRGMNSHCLNGGWRLGHTIDGTQAEYVRIINADSSLHHVPKGCDEKALVMLSDILPTGLECGVLNGKVSPGGSVAIVGGGPVGLAALMTAQLYSPSLVVMIDKDQNRLKVAQKLGAQHVIDPGQENAEEKVKQLTDGIGCDTVIEAVGVPVTFQLCQDLVAPGGTIANVGVHGTKCDLHLEKLWSHNICEFSLAPLDIPPRLKVLPEVLQHRMWDTWLNPSTAITTRLVDTVTTPMLLRLFAGGKIAAGDLITHRKFFLKILGMSNRC